MDVKTGDLVWAKLGRCRSWPGLIVEPTRDLLLSAPLGALNNKASVYFFGINCFSWVSKEDIKSYFEFRSNYADEKENLVKNKNKRLFKAVSEIEKYIRDNKIDELSDNHFQSEPRNNSYSDCIPTNFGEKFDITADKEARLLDSEDKCPKVEVIEKFVSLQKLINLQVAIKRFGLHSPSLNDFLSKYNFPGTEASSLSASSSGAEESPKNKKPTTNVNSDVANCSKKVVIASDKVGYSNFNDIHTKDILESSSSDIAIFSERVMNEEGINNNKKNSNPEDESISLLSSPEEDSDNSLASSVEPDEDEAENRHVRNVVNTLFDQIEQNRLFKEKMMTEKEEIELKSPTNHQLNNNNVNEAVNFCDDFVIQEAYNSVELSMNGTQGHDLQTSRCQLNNESSLSSESNTHLVSIGSNEITRPMRKRLICDLVSEKSQENSGNCPCKKTRLST